MQHVQLCIFFPSIIRLISQFYVFPKSNSSSALSLWPIFIQTFQSKYSELNIPIAIAVHMNRIQVFQLFVFISMNMLFCKSVIYSQISIAIENYAFDILQQLQCNLNEICLKDNSILNEWSKKQNVVSHAKKKIIKNWIKCCNHLDINVNNEIIINI